MCAPNLQDQVDAILHRDVTSRFACPARYRRYVSTCGLFFGAPMRHHPRELWLQFKGPPVSSHRRLLLEVLTYKINIYISKSMNCSVLQKAYIYYNLLLFLGKKDCSILFYQEFISLLKNENQESINYLTVNSKRKFHELSSSECSTDDMDCNAYHQGGLQP